MKLDIIVPWDVSFFSGYFFFSKYFVVPFFGGGDVNFSSLCIYVGRPHLVGMD